MRCEEQNINYGEQCSRKATWLYEKPGTHRYLCTQHAPKRNRFCKPIAPVAHKATFEVKNYASSQYAERITWTCSCGKTGSISDGAQGCTMARAKRAHARHAEAGSR